MAHSPRMSPDTVSSLFPDRPIRPLPKRRLREKLSPEVADSIKYPPSTYETTPLFYYPPYTWKEEGSSSRAGSVSPVYTNRPSETGLNPVRIGAGLTEGDEDETTLRSTLVTRSPPEILSRTAPRTSRPNQIRQPNPQPPPSTTSSVDGYDSFENSNNKKKRKIPSAGDSNINGATNALHNDIGSLPLSADTYSPNNDFDGERPYAQATSSAFIANNQGISGPGRGRLGRSRNGRSPLRALSDGNNSWSGGASKSSPTHWASDYEGPGIISSAIANAEKHRPQGQENVSLLPKHSYLDKSTPASTQFTFTCDSQVPGTVQWPGHTSVKHMGNQAMSAPSSGMNSTHGTGHRGPSKDVHDAERSRKREARRLEKEFNRAARQRRRAAEDKFLHNPPNPKDIWICEFCEYERIFGTPPRLLIRDFEKKDYERRVEEADRKRLLEKAKAKSRKAKKNNANATKGQAGQNQSQVSEEPLDSQDDPPMRHQDDHSTGSSRNSTMAIGRDTLNEVDDPGDCCQDSDHDPHANQAYEIEAFERIR